MTYEVISNSGLTREENTAYSSWLSSKNPGTVLFATLILKKALTECLQGAKNKRKKRSKLILIVLATIMS